MQLKCHRGIHRATGTYTMLQDQKPKGPDQTVQIMTCQDCLNAHMLFFFIPRHTIVVGYYGFTLDIRVAVNPSISRTSIPILFLDDNLNKHQWIFTKLGMCIDVMEIWFGIANGQISSNFDGVICPRHTHILVSRR